MTSPPCETLTFHTSCLCFMRHSNSWQWYTGKGEPKSKSLLSLKEAAHDLLDVISGMFIQELGAPDRLSYLGLTCTAWLSSAWTRRTS